MVRRREENEAKKVKKRNWVKERAPPSFLGWRVTSALLPDPARSPSVPFLISPARFLASLLSPPLTSPSSIPLLFLTNSSTVIFLFSGMFLLWRSVLRRMIEKDRT